MHRTLTLDVSSPAQFKGQIADIVNTKGNKYRYLNLIVSDPKLLVRPFQFPSNSLKDLRSLLYYEAGELLSMPSSEIDVDYQILRSDKDIVCGIFVCISKKVLCEYLSIIFRADLVPLTITTPVLANINSFFGKFHVKKGRVCFLDFSKEQKLNIVIFNDGRCELLRAVFCDNSKQRNKEVIQSLRSVCASSNLKKIDHIYFYGKTEGIEEIRKDVKERFDVEGEALDDFDINDAFLVGKRHLELNLAKKHALSLLSRNRLLQSANAALVVSLVLVLFLGARIIYKGRELHSLDSLYSEKDYQYAMDLKNKIEVIESGE